MCTTVSTIFGSHQHASARISTRNVTAIRQLTKPLGYQFTLSKPNAVTKAFRISQKFDIAKTLTDYRIIDTTL